MKTMEYPREYAQTMRVIVQLGPPFAELGDDEGDPLAPPLPSPDEDDGVSAGIRVDDEGDCPALGPPLAGSATMRVIRQHLHFPSLTKAMEYSREYA